VAILRLLTTGSVVRIRAGELIAHLTGWAISLYNKELAHFGYNDT